MSYTDSRLQGIRTRYLPAANVKGSRMKATAAGGKSLTVSYDHALGIAGNHGAAAVALVAKMAWDNDLIGCTLDNGDMAWVLVPVAKVLGMGYPIGVGYHPTSSANAQLIAAAPDMLKALTALMQCLNAALDAGARIDPAHMRANLTLGNAAIAQAHGARYP